MSERPEKTAVNESAVDKEITGVSSDSNPAFLNARQYNYSQNRTSCLVKNAFFGQDSTSVMASSKRWGYIGLTARFQNASDMKNTLHVLNTNVENRNQVRDVVSELSFPDTHFDRQPHIHHKRDRNS